MSEVAEQGFAQLAVDQWKLLGVLERLIPRLPPEMQPRVTAQARFAARQLDALTSAYEFRLETFDGFVFEPNLPLSAINSDEVDAARGAIVGETLEPAVIRQGRIVHLGKVALTAGEDDAPRN